MTVCIFAFLDAGAWGQSVATCGGETVCVIDCESGHVLKKYKVPGEVCNQLFPVIQFFTTRWCLSKVLRFVFLHERMLH